MEANKILNIQFANSNLKIFLYDNPVADVIYTKFKHLANVPIELYEGDVFFNCGTIEQAGLKLVDYARALGIDIDSSLFQDQSYLNFLHRLYEENFNGHELWLKFHEHIHIVEKILYNRVQPIVSIDYRTRAGKLEEKFDRKFLQYATDRVAKNQCFVQWQELAKTPYQYFANKEPNDITRICQLVKPWLSLRPSLHFACDEIDFLADSDPEAFDQWFAKYKEPWCAYWNVPDWNSLEPFLVIPIGEIESADLLVDKLKNNQLPLRITH
jgi:hypothetical protein